MRRTHRPRLLSPLFLTLSLGLAGEVGAGPLINGDFADFGGWSGDRVDLDDPNNDEIGIDPTTGSPQFKLIGGGFAALTTSDPFDEVWLYQSFTLAPSAARLSFAYDWTLTATDPDFPDFVQATLWTDGFLDSIDLFPSALDTSAPAANGTATTDVSRLAGLSVVLEFAVQDGDFQLGDELQIGNITIAEAPLPGPWTLVLAGLVPLLGARLTQQQPPLLGRAGLRKGIC